MKDNSDAADGALNAIALSVWQNQTKHQHVNEKVVSTDKK